MAIIRKKDIRNMGAEEVKTKVLELQQELRIERAKMAAGGTPDNPGKMHEMKKTMARLYTVAGEKGYKIHE